MNQWNESNKKWSKDSPIQRRLKSMVTMSYIWTTFESWVGQTKKDTVFEVIVERKRKEERKKEKKKKK